MTAPFQAARAKATDFFWCGAARRPPLRSLYDGLTKRWGHDFRTHDPTWTRMGCVHEAGHVVAGLGSGLLVCLAHWNVRGGGWAITWPVDSKHHSDAVGAAIMAWGGAVAEGTDPWINAPDARTFRALGMGITTVRFALAQCRSLLREHRAAIGAVAAALEERGTLGPRALRRIAVAASPALASTVPSIPRKWPPRKKIAAYLSQWKLPTDTVDEVAR